MRCSIPGCKNEDAVEMIVFIAKKRPSLTDRPGAGNQHRVLCPEHCAQNMLLLQKHKGRGFVVEDDVHNFGFAYCDVKECWEVSQADAYVERNHTKPNSRRPVLDGLDELERRVYTENRTRRLCIAHIRRNAELLEQSDVGLVPENDAANAGGG